MAGKRAIDLPHMQGLNKHTWSVKNLKAFFQAHLLSYYILAQINSLLMTE